MTDSLPEEKGETKRNPGWLFYGVFLFIFASDQWSKVKVEDSFFLGESKVIIPDFFNLTYVINDGMAFGLFQGNNFLLGIIVCCIVAVGIYWGRQLNWKHKEINILAGLIAAGALGNLTDRVRLGYVVDFLDVYLGMFKDLPHWPTFNIADSAISVTVVWICFRMWTGKFELIEEQEKKREKSKS